MPFNRTINNNNNNNNNSLLAIKSSDEHFVSTSKEYNSNYEEEIDEDGDDEYNEIDEADDDDEEYYFENIIKEVISDQTDSNNNEQSSQWTHSIDASQSAQASLASSSAHATQVIKVSEDDLLDQRDLLRAIFKSDLLDRYECRCDTNQGLFITKQTKLSKSLQRKLANLYQLLHQYQLQPAQADNLLLDQMNNPAKINQILTNSLQNQEYKKKLFRSMRSIIERILIDALMICDQYHNQLQQQEQQQSTTNSSSTPNSHNPTTKLWCEIRSRGCQFLGPQMQDDVLRLILHALETVTRMSRKVLVLYVVHMLKKHYPKASKTSVGHVVQLLYRAGCFKVEKRENDSSLMELKKEYAKYAALRRQHDTQIIQIALESGIRMSPEQWSQKLFGDSNHKSEMQSIIDKLQSQQTLEKLISDFYDKLSTSNCAALSSASSSPSSSFSTNRSNSCSSSGSANFDLAVNSLFLQVKNDFDYFALVNFEKKQAQQTLVTSQQSSQMKRNDIGSGGESLASEDDESSSFADHHDLNSYDFEDDFDLKLLSSATSSSSTSTKASQSEQTKIVWSLLVDCLKRAAKIAASHIEYSSKMMSLIMANNAASRLATNVSSTTTSGAKQSRSHRYELDDLEPGFTSGGVNANQMRSLVAMGPNSALHSSSAKFNNLKRFNQTNNSKHQAQQFISNNSGTNLLNNNNVNNNNNANSKFNSNTANNLFGSNSIYDFNNSTTCNKPPGFYQQSNNIFDLSMVNKNFNKNFYDTKSKQFFNNTNNQYQHQPHHNPTDLYHQFTSFNSNSKHANGRKQFNE